jgi:arginine deiminase
MNKRGVEVIPLSSEEQRLWGCTFVPIEPNVVVHYNFAWREETKQILRQRGVNIIEFQPDALLAGGGSLRCLTLRLWREKVN